MYLVLTTFVTGDTSQESFNSKARAMAYVYGVLDVVKSVEIKQVR